MAPKNASRPYFVLTEVEAHACPSCHQDAPGHVVIGPDGIGFGTTYYGDEGEEEADELAEMLNDAFEKGVTQRAAREHQAAVILATALAGGGSPEQAHWMHDAAAWLNDRRAAETPLCPVTFQPVTDSPFVQCTLPDKHEGEHHASSAVVHETLLAEMRQIISRVDEYETSSGLSALDEITRLLEVSERIREQRSPEKADGAPR